MKKLFTTLFLLLFVFLNVLIAKPPINNSVFLNKNENQYQEINLHLNKFRTKPKVSIGSWLMAVGGVLSITGAIMVIDNNNKNSSTGATFVIIGTTALTTGAIINSDFSR